MNRTSRLSASSPHGRGTAASLRAGHRVTLPAVPDTIADGLRHTGPARLPWEVNKVFLDDVVTVTDDDIAQAMRWRSIT